MARRISRKRMKHDEFVEAAFDAGVWLEENWKKVAGALGAAVAAVLIVSGWFAWSSHQKDKAGRLFDEGFLLYRGSVSGDGATDAAQGSSKQERYRQALDWFDQAANKAGRSPLGNVATFYQGIIHLESGNPGEAARILEQVVSRARYPAVGDTARAKLAEAYAATGEEDKARALWSELAEAPDTFFPQDLALLNLGKLLRRQGKADEARDVLQDLLDSYPQSFSAAEAQRLMERARRDDASSAGYPPRPRP